VTLREGNWKLKQLKGTHKKRIPVEGHSWLHAQEVEAFLNRDQDSQIAQREEKLIKLQAWSTKLETALTNS
jgi:hypothetical protein